MIIKGNLFILKVYLLKIAISFITFVKKKISKYLHSPPNSVYDQIKWIKDNIKKKIHWIL